MAFRRRTRKYRPRAYAGSQRVLRNARVRRELPSFIRSRAPERKLVRYFPAAPPEETFYFNNNLLIPTGPATNIHLINEVPLLNSVTGRSGNRIRMLELHVRFTVFAPVQMSDATVISTMRFTIGLFKTPHGSNPNWNTLLSTNILELDYPGSNENFGVIYDKIFDMGMTLGSAPTTPAWQGFAPSFRSHRVFDFRLPLNMDAVWLPNSAVGGISDMRKNAIYFLFRTNENADTALNWRCNLFHRLAFVDY